jgi:hypothetical protein
MNLKGVYSEINSENEANENILVSGTRLKRLKTGRAR